MSRADADEDSIRKRDDPPPEFARECERANVRAEHYSTLWRLYCGRERRDGERLRGLFDDYAHWRLFRASVAGDRVASERFERYWNQAVRSFLGRGFTEDQVEEFAGVFFEKVYRKAGNFDWRSPFSVYLRRILLNIARDELRRLTRLRRAHQRLVEQSDSDVAEEGPIERDPSPEELVLDAERHTVVRQCLEQLTPLDRHVVVHCLVDGRSGQDLAESIGITRDALYQRLYRAKKRLRALLKRALADR